MRTLLMTALASLALAGSVQAAELQRFRIEDTGGLADLCAKSDDVQARQFCNGFIVGAGTMYREVVRAGGMKPVACVDKEPTLEDARLAFVGFMDKNKAVRDEPAIDGFFRAMSAKWPCKS